MAPAHVARFLALLGCALARPDDCDCLRPFGWFGVHHHARVKASHAPISINPKSRGACDLPTHIAPCMAPTAPAIGCIDGLDLACDGADVQASTSPSLRRRGTMAPRKPASVTRIGRTSFGRSPSPAVARIVSLPSANLAVHRGTPCPVSAACDHRRESLLVKDASADRPSSPTNPCTITGCSTAHQPACHGTHSMCSRSACRCRLPSSRSSAFRVHGCALHPAMRAPDRSGQTTAMDHRFYSTQQHATAQRMHRPQCIAKALLQYFGGAHGVVSSGFVTREE